MKFLIFKTSDIRSKPHDKAFKDKAPYAENHIYGLEECWYIEINSLRELEKLIDEFGRKGKSSLLLRNSFDYYDLDYPQDKVLRIEVFDDYQG